MLYYAILFNLAARVSITMVGSALSEGDPPQNLAAIVRLETDPSTSTLVEDVVVVVSVTGGSAGNI